MARKINVLRPLHSKVSANKYENIGVNTNIAISKCEKF
jgi:hypothetical protein